MAISVVSKEGRRLVEMLKHEFGIPAGATRVAIDYEVGGLFRVSCDYLPAPRAAAEIEVTSLTSGSREFTQGVK
ncbi:hypothetical protein [Variovorax paradoxus]|uniref:hypothetical protein n=1 Tax=Variovorax paradoxus TaxID=34073 RepID=UPI0019346D01|nr:hypothetical protein INQ48_20425 [Variovorax paradoxus]